MVFVSVEALDILVGELVKFPKKIVKLNSLT